MDKLKQEITDHIICIDKLLEFSSFTDKTLIEWCTPLIDVMTPDGAVPYLLGESKERYRASPLASTIIAMEEADLLPDSAVAIMLDKLLFLRDNAIADDKQKTVREKKHEDSAGWSLSEGVSVWSTSLALIALLNSAEGIKKAVQYKDSILWLADQRKAGNDGWGYQLWDNCEQNSIMTALALRALTKAYRYRNEFAFNDYEERKLLDSIINGFKFLKDTVKISLKSAYWSFKGEPHCAATAWVLLALKEMAGLKIDQEVEKFNAEIVGKGLNFIESQMPGKCFKWGAEQIVCEAGAKYSKQKNYYSFSAALLSELFEVGMSPYNPKVIKQIKWLLHNIDEWKIEEYDTGERCSFTYAMVLAVIVKWVTLVGRENARTLACNYSSKKVSILEKIYGLPAMKQQCIQIIYKPQIQRNAILFCIGAAALIFVVKIWKYINDFAAWIMAWLGHAKEDFIIGVIASLFATLIVAVFTCTGNFILKFSRR